MAEWNDLEKIKMKARVKEAELKVRDIRKTFGSFRTRHELHMAALDRYYHVVHKRCPCKIMVDDEPMGKCESPWLDADYEGLG